MISYYSPVPYGVLMTPLYTEPKALYHPEKGFYIGQDMVTGDAVFKPLDQIKKDQDPVPCFMLRECVGDYTKIAPDDYEKLQLHIVWKKDCKEEHAPTQDRAWYEVPGDLVEKGTELMTKVVSELPIGNNVMRKVRRSLYQRKLQRLETQSVAMPQARPAHFMKRPAPRKLDV